MKNFFALLLLSVMCFSLVACGNKARKEIVGEWKCSDFIGSGERSIIFNKDGTGTTDIFGGERDFKWKYDKDLSLHIIAFEDSQLANVTIKTDDNGRYIYVNGKFYFVEE